MPFYNYEENVGIPDKGKKRTRVFFNPIGCHHSNHCVYNVLGTIFRIITTIDKKPYW